jgi:hypothetical protein
VPAIFERAAARIRAHRAKLGTANKATELSDFSVSTTWGIAGKNLYRRDLSA